MPTVLAARRLAARNFAAELSARLKVEGGLLVSRRRPLLLRSPEPGVLQVHVRRRLLVAAHEKRDRRLVHHPGFLPLQPAVVPLEHLVPEVDPGTGQRVLGPVVAPRTQQDLSGDVQLGESPQDRCGVGIGPAAPEQHRDLDAAVIRLQGTLPPVGPLQRMGDVADAPGDVVLQALLPQLLPQRPGDPGVGGREVVGRHQRRVAVEHVGADRAAGVGPVEVDVGVRRPHHQGPEVRRPLRRHLPLHDAAVRHPPHADGAAAPGPGGNPFHRLVPVAPFPLRVDVGGRAPRVAGAADVVADDGVAAAGEPGRPVPAVVVAALRNAGFYAAQPAVGVVLDDRRELSGRIGTRDHRRQLDSVAHRHARAVELHLVLRFGYGPAPSVHVVTPGY